MVNNVIMCIGFTTIPDYLFNRLKVTGKYKFAGNEKKTKVKTKILHLWEFKIYDKYIMEQ